MKITLHHYAHMRSAIAAIPADTIAAIKSHIASDPRVKDAAKRLRWDLSYAAGLTSYICDHVYAYADDAHVDTALRAIVRELNHA